MTVVEGKATFLLNKVEEVEKIVEIRTMVIHIHAQIKPTVTKLLQIHMVNSILASLVMVVILFDIALVNAYIQVVL